MADVRQWLNRRVAVGFFSFQHFLAVASGVGDSPPHWRPQDLPGPDLKRGLHLIFLCSLGDHHLACERLPFPFPAYPWTPFLGGLLLNCLVCRCLNLGGPFLGVTGPPTTLVADRISALGSSRFMMRMAEIRQ